MSSRIRQAEKPYLRHDIAEVDVGDTVSVSVRITEGDRQRVQVFTGTVIKKRGSGLGRTFTVRRIVQGEGVERVFPFHSPILEGVEVVRKGRVRRAKLYYLRQRVGKATRLREVLGGRRAPKTARPTAEDTETASEDESSASASAPVEQTASSNS